MKRRELLTKRLRARLTRQVQKSIRRMRDAGDPDMASRVERAAGRVVDSWLEHALARRGWLSLGRMPLRVHHV